MVPFWAPQSQRRVTDRLCATRPLEKITFVTSSAHARMTASFVLDGAMNGSLFLACVKRAEVDNLPVDRVAGLADAIEAARATTLYLAPYSPNLNPIALVSAK
jgi:hypothetical protein